MLAMVEFLVLDEYILQVFPEFLPEFPELCLSVARLYSTSYYTFVNIISQYSSS